MQYPYLLTFPKLGNDAIGYISVAESGGSVPFEVRRTFWTYYTPEMIVRGRHAHYCTEQVLVAVAGRIVVTTEMPDGEVQAYVLHAPHVGLYIPPCAWHTMQYSAGTVQLTLVSSLYTEDDYIRSYEEYQRVWRAKAL